MSYNIEPEKKPVITGTPSTLSSESQSAHTNWKLLGSEGTSVEPDGGVNMTSDEIDCLLNVTVPDRVR